tara:strand:+ start:112 stop:462 length:351 start_codon:yes stop_codon:yes gene_type:complete
MKITITQAKKMFKESLFDDSVIKKYSSILGDHEWEQLINGGEHYNREWAKVKSLGWDLGTFLDHVWEGWKSMNTELKLLQPEIFLRLQFLYTQEEIRNAFTARDMMSQVVRLDINK